MIPTAFELAGLGRRWWDPGNQMERLRDRLKDIGNPDASSPASPGNTKDKFEKDTSTEKLVKDDAFKDGLPDSAPKPFDWKVVAIPAAILVVAIGIGLVIRKRSQEA